MNSNVLINKTNIDGDSITVYFMIPALNIDSQYQMTNKDFQEQMSIGGFKQLGYFLIETLENGLRNMMKDAQIQPETLVKDIDINK